MNIDFTTFSTGALAVVPVIIALVQVFKLTGWVNDKFAPLLSIGLGMGVGWLADHNSADLTNTLLNGVIYGLSASGLYSGIKTTAEAVKIQKRERAEKEEKK